MQDETNDAEPAQRSSMPVALSPMMGLSVKEVLERMERVRELLAKAMKPDHHYGVIPGTKKKTLLKPGAEMLCLMLGLTARYEITKTELPNSHREYDVTCRLLRQVGVDDSGRPILLEQSSGVGSASTMEKKYRWRKSGRSCPACQAEGSIIKSKKEDGWYCFPKKGGCGESFAPDDPDILDQEVDPIENEDIADTWNTVKKIACKRAFIAATTQATAATDVFENPEEAVKAEKARAAASNTKKALTAKEKLIRECVDLKKHLEESGLTADGFASMFEEAKIPAPKKAWGELDETQLTGVKAMFAAELAKGSEVQS